MADVVVRLSASGVRSLLFKSGETQALINQKAIQICNSANAKVKSNDNMYNPPFMWAGHMGSVSYHARVFASNPHGLRAEKKYKALSSSVK